MLSNSRLLDCSFELPDVHGSVSAYILVRLSHTVLPAGCEDASQEAGWSPTNS